MYCSQLSVLEGVSGEFWGLLSGYNVSHTITACRMLSPSGLTHHWSNLHNSKYTGLTNGFSKLSYYWSAALVGICSQNSSTLFQKEITNLYTGQTQPSEQMPPKYIAQRRGTPPPPAVPSPNNHHTTHHGTMPHYDNQNWGITLRK